MSDFSAATLNLMLLAIIGFDLMQRCPYYFSTWYYVEYGVVAVLTANFIYYAVRCRLKLAAVEDSKKRLCLNPLVATRKVANVKIEANLTPVNVSATQVNLSALSWQSSFNDKTNRSLNASASLSRNVSYGSANILSTSDQTYRVFSDDDSITDGKKLKEYLEQVNKAEEKSLLLAKSKDCSFQASKFSSFWNTFRLDDLTNTLKTTQYQLSPFSASLKQKDDTASSPFSTQDVVDGFQISPDEVSLSQLSSAKLSGYVTNIRIWIAETILHRIVNEIDNINERFKSRGLTDLQIGFVSLERLKKTTENYQLLSQVPKLPNLIPFLDLTSNQEYLINRIRDLAKGKCIASYRWDSGGSYGSHKWTDHLATDSAILFHLFCCYFDNQLHPTPDRSRSFYNKFVIVVDTKISQTEVLALVKNNQKCAILCSNAHKPPKFNFIGENKIHKCAYDRNNLFNVIIQFLLHMKTHNEGLLDGVSLGKSGINILSCFNE